MRNTLLVLLLSFAFLGCEAKSTSPSSPNATESANTEVTNTKDAESNKAMDNSASDATQEVAAKLPEVRFYVLSDA